MIGKEEDGVVSGIKCLQKIMNVTYHIVTSFLHYHMFLINDFQILLQFVLNSITARYTLDPFLLEKSAMDYQGLSDDNICPACGKYLRTTQGLHAHLSSARSCSWWTKRNMENREKLDVNQPEGDVGGASDVDDDVNLGLDLNMDIDTDIDTYNNHGEEFGEGFHPELDSVPPELPPFEEAEDIFHFVGTTSSRRTRPPQSRALYEEDDQQVVEVDKTAGKVIGQDQKLFDKWNQIFGHGTRKESLNMDVDEEPGAKPNPYAPFTSELDWRIARWAVRDNPGHKAFDRLLSIPGEGLPP